MMAGPEGALLGAGGMDHGVKVENTGRPGGQSLYLAMMDGHQGPC